VRFAGIAASPDETDAIQSARVTAARALLRDDLDAGLEALLGAAQRNRRYATGEGRTDVLAAFSLFAPDDARLAVARRRFAALLH
jgi:thioredoxin-like negative regulator of GroEL